MSEMREGERDKITQDAVDVDKLIDPKDRWAYPIGKFILAFTQIEAIADICLQFIPSDKIYDQLKVSGISRKLDLVVAFTQSRTPEPIPEKISNELIGIIKEIKNYLPDRNMIAHNPLEIVIDEEINEDGSYQIKEIEEAIVHMHNEDKRIGFDDLGKLIEGIDILTNEFGAFAARSSMHCTKSK